MIKTVTKRATPKVAATTLFRARVPVARLARVEKVLARLGMKPGDAFNLLLAQIELREELPFAVTTQPTKLLSDAAQAQAWTDQLGDY